MKLIIHYETQMRCAEGCGTWVNRMGQTCNTCLVKVEQKNATALRATLRERLDRWGPLAVNEHGQPI